MELLQNLEKVQAKLQLLVAKTVELEKQNQQLTSENKELKATLELQHKEVLAVQHKFKRWSEEQKESGKTQSVLDQDIRQQIDQYLIEIDQCIEWLKQQ